MAGADDVTKNLDNWHGMTLASLFALADTASKQMEAYAKDPPFPLRPLRRDEVNPVTGQKGTWEPKGEGPFKWRDRLSHARQGLFGYTTQRDAAIVARIAHSEQYGVYLELAHQGRYGVLQRARDHVAPAFFREAARLLQGGPV